MSKDKDWSLEDTGILKFPQKRDLHKAENSLEAGKQAESVRRESEAALRDLGRDALADTQRSRLSSVDQFRLLLRRTGLSHEQAAKVLGTNMSRIVRWCEGYGTPPDEAVATLKKLADGLGD